MEIFSSKFKKYTNGLQRHPPSSFVWLGVIFAAVFWFLDSWIDILFFTDASYVESFIPNGMELYMRLFVSFLLIVFGLIVSRYVAENNRLSEYLEAIGKDEQKRYRALFDFAPIAVIILDADFRIIKWNNEADKIFGWNQSDVIGMTIFEIMQPVDVRTKTGSIEDVLTGNGDLVGRNITQDGENPLWNWHYSPIMDDAGQMAHMMFMGERA